MKEVAEVIVSRDLEESQGKVTFFGCNRYRCLNPPTFYVRIPSKLWPFWNPPPVMGIFQYEMWKLSLSLTMEGLFVKTPSTCLHLFWCLVGTLVLSGCQGSGQTINFVPHALSSQPTRAEAVQGNDLTILVEPFQDARPQQHRLGSRTHFWGGVTHFSAWNDDISEGTKTKNVDLCQQGNTADAGGGCGNNDDKSTKPVSSG